MEPVKSISRGEITELMHIAPIKRGVVPHIHVPLTYADRLRQVLRAFNDREQQGFPNVIRLFGGIHSSHWALIDGDTRLLLCVVFDGNWHDYLRVLARDTPALLHLIWSNCEGWRPLYDSPERGIEAEAEASRRMFEFVQSYQVQLSFWYAHSPRLTVRDIEWLEQLRRAADAGLPLAQADTSAARLYANAMHAQRPLSRQDRLQRALRSYDYDTSGQSGGLRVAAAQLGFRRLAAIFEEPEYLAAYAEAFGSLQGAKP